MRLLVDTHVWLWWLAGEPLSKKAADLVADPVSEVWLSSASVWEAAIKASLGKLDVPEGALDASLGFDELAIRWAHAEAVKELPLHHRDPFDRMIIAQAQVESMTVVTRDHKFDAYEVQLVAA